MAQAPYDAFRDFLKDIVTQVNKLADNGDAMPEEGNAVVTDAKEKLVAIDDDSETPF